MQNLDANGSEKLAHRKCELTSRAAARDKIDTDLYSHCGVRGQAHQKLYLLKNGLERELVFFRSLMNLISLLTEKYNANHP